MNVVEYSSIDVMISNKSNSVRGQSRQHNCCWKSYQIRCFTLFLFDITIKKTRERGQKMRIQSNNIQAYKNLRFSTANSLKRRIIRLSTAIDAITNGWLVFMYVRYPLLSNTINMKSTSLLLLLLLWLYLITIQEKNREKNETTNKWTYGKKLVVSVVEQLFDC